MEAVFAEAAHYRADVSCPMERRARVQIRERIFLYINETLVKIRPKWKLSFSYIDVKSYLPEQDKKLLA